MLGRGAFAQRPRGIAACTLEPARELPVSALGGEAHPGVEGGSSRREERGHVEQAAERGEHVGVSGGGASLEQRVGARAPPLPPRGSGRARRDPVALGDVFLGDHVGSPDEEAGARAHAILGVGPFEAAGRFDGERPRLRVARPPHLDLGPPGVGRHPGVARLGGPRDRLARRLVDEMDRAHRGERRGPREPCAGRLRGATEALPEERRPRRALERASDVSGVRGARGLAREVRRLVDHRARPRRELHRPPERDERRGRPSARQLEGPADRLEARVDVAVEWLGEGVLDGAQPGLRRAAPPRDQRSHLGGRGTGRAVDEPLGSGDIALVPRHPREGGHGRPIATGPLPPRSPDRAQTRAASPSPRRREISARSASTSGPATPLSATHARPASPARARARASWDASVGDACGLEASSSASARAAWLGAARASSRTRRATRSARSPDSHPADRALPGPASRARPRRSTTPDRVTSASSRKRSPARPRCGGPPRRATPRRSTPRGAPSTARDERPRADRSTQRPVGIRAPACRPIRSRPPATRAPDRRPRHRATRPARRHARARRGTPAAPGRRARGPAPRDRREAPASGPLSRRPTRRSAFPPRRARGGPRPIARPRRSARDPTCASRRSDRPPRPRAGRAPPRGADRAPTGRRRCLLRRRP